MSAGTQPVETGLLKGDLKDEYFKNFTPEQVYIYIGTVELHYNVPGRSVQFSTLYLRCVISDTIQYCSASYGTVLYYVIAKYML